MGQCKQKVMGSILTSMSDFGCSLIFRKMWHRQHQGSVRAVFRRKMTDWTAQSIIVNR